MVRPLAFYPLAILAVILFIQFIRKSIKFEISGSVMLLGLFLTAAFVASAWGWSFAPIPMHGQEFLGRSLRAWATLAGGMVFLTCTIMMNKSEQDLRFSIKWLYVGLAVSFIWGMIQMISYYTGFPNRLELNKVQLSFSIRKLLAKKRAAGFAFEPSWLANQIASIYMPWLFAAVLSGYRVFRRRWIEPTLLLAATILLVVTFSRGGILMAFGTLIIVLIVTQTSKLRIVLQWFARPLKKEKQPDLVKIVSIRVGVVFALLAVIVSTVLVLSTNKYFSQIWRSQKTSLTEYAVDIYAGPRLAYAAAGWDVFLDHPITGVGLGASGLYLYDHIPDWAITTLSEITRQMTLNAWLYPNPKNLYIRILSETGVVGFILYLLFWLGVLGVVFRQFIKKDFFHGLSELAGCSPGLF